MPKANLKITGVALIFTVQSLERTLRFYADTLGLALEQQEGYLLCKLASGTELLFFEGEAVRGTSPQVVFGLDEGGIDTAAEALAACGGSPVFTRPGRPGGARAAAA